MSGVVPQVAALMKPWRGRHGVNIQASPTSCQSCRAGLDGARRPAKPDQGGDGRGRDPGGVRQGVAHPHAYPRRRPRGGLRRGPAPPSSATSLLPAELRGAAAEAGALQTRRPAGRGSSRHPPRLAAQALRHVRRDRADRGRRRLVRREAALGDAIITCLRAHGHGIVPRSASSRTSRSYLGGILESDPPTRPRASVNLATPTASPAVHQDVPGFWSAPRSSRPGSSGTASRGVRGGSAMVLKSRS